MVNVFLWAVLTNRTYVIQYTDPHPLQECLVPNLVHWSVDLPSAVSSSSGNNATKKKMKTMTLSKVDGTLSKATLKGGDLEAEWKEFDVVEVVGANMPCEPALRKNPHYDLDSLGFPKTCARVLKRKFRENARRLNTQMNFWKGVVLHALFKPSAAVLAMSRPVLDRMSGYDVTLGIHVRLGGSVGGAADPKRSRDVDYKLWFSSCALNLTKVEQSQNGRSVAWFIISDQALSDLSWLTAVAGRQDIPILTLEKERVVHTDRSGGQTVQEWRETVSDWFILSMTSQILQSPSSFSLTAALWAGKQPFMLGESCTKVVS